MPFLTKLSVKGNTGIFKLGPILSTSGSKWPKGPQRHKSAPVKCFSHEPWSGNQFYFNSVNFKRNCRGLTWSRSTFLKITKTIYILSALKGLCSPYYVHRGHQTYTNSTIFRETLIKFITFHLCRYFTKRKPCFFLFSFCFFTSPYPMSNFCQVHQCKV